MTHDARRVRTLCASRRGASCSARSSPRGASRAASSSPSASHSDSSPCSCLLSPVPCFPVSCLLARIGIQAGGREHAAIRALALLVDVGAVPRQLVGAPPDQQHEAEVDEPAERLEPAAAGVLDVGEERDVGDDPEEDAVDRGAGGVGLDGDAGDEHRARRRRRRACRAGGPSICPRKAPRRGRRRGCRPSA